MKRFTNTFIILALVFISSLAPCIPCSAAAKRPEYTRISCIRSDSSDSVTLRWYKADDATHYRIYYRSSSASKWKRIATVSSTKRSYTHTSSVKYPLVAGRQYYYTVRAYNRHYKTLGGYSRLGRAITVCTKEADPIVNPDDEEAGEDAERTPLDTTIDDSESIIYNGTTFDLSDFPLTKTITYGLSGVSVSWNGNGSEHIRLVINDGDTQIIRHADTPSTIPLCNTDISVDQYCVPSWQEMCAYIYEKRDTNSVSLDMYKQIKPGSFTVKLYYDDHLIRTCNVNVTTADTNELYYHKLADKIASNTWTSDMSDEDKILAAKKYISEHFTYKQVDCKQGARLILILARNLGYDSWYRFVGPHYDMYGKNGEASETWSHMNYCGVGGHTVTMVDFGGEYGPLLVEANGHM